jgi:hypothetical protein
MMLAEDEYETLHTDIEELIESPIFWKWRYSCKMKKIVPEFKSMNSTYAVLDK